MNPDLILAILKTSGAIISGVLGVTALFSEFRNEKGELNFAGRIVLSGILLSTSVAAITSALESLNGFRGNQEQFARNEALLRQINRAVEPISELKIGFMVSIEPNDPIVESYRERLKAGVLERVSELEFPKASGKAPGLSIVTKDIDRSIISVAIEPDSNLWPHLPNEAPIDSVVRHGSPSITLMRTPVPPQSLPLYSESCGSRIW